MDQRKRTNVLIKNPRSSHIIGNLNNHKKSQSSARCALQTTSRQLWDQSERFVSEDRFEASNDDKIRQKLNDNIFHLLCIQHRLNDFIEINDPNSNVIHCESSGGRINFDNENLKIGPGMDEMINSSSNDRTLFLNRRSSNSEFRDRIIDVYNEYLNTKREKRNVIKSKTDDDIVKIAREYLGDVISPGNFSDKYVLGEKVGKGATSIVKTCYLKSTDNHPETVNTASEANKLTNPQKNSPTKKSIENSNMKANFVVKIVSIGSSKSLCRILCFETEIMHALQSRNIVKFYDCFVSNNPKDSTFSMYLVMEHLSGLNISHLSDLIVLPDDHIKTIAYEILKGLEYLHNLKIIHRDIKGGNIIADFDSKRVVIVDFGFAADLKRNSKHNTLVGTYHWIAPEVILRRFYAYPADMWSFGIVIIEMFQGLPPFTHLKNSHEIFNAILTTDVISGVKDIGDASRDFLGVLRLLLIKDDKKRATISQLRKEPFFINRMTIGESLKSINELLNEEES